jgi:hypothetical protein
MAVKRLPVVHCQTEVISTIPGLKVALDVVSGRLKAISDRLSMQDIAQELERVQAMLRLEIEFASKVGKPLKKEKTK